MTDDGPFPAGSGREVRDDEPDAYGRLKWPFDDPHNGRRLVQELTGDVLYVMGRGWGVWAGGHYDFARGEVLVVHRAYEALLRSVEDEAEVAKGAPLPAAQIAALAAEHGLDRDEAEKRARQERVKSRKARVAKCGNIAVVERALKMARAGLMVDQGALDNAHGFVTAPNGAIDLAEAAVERPDGEEPEEREVRLGKVLKPFVREHRSTRCLRVAYDVRSPCPRWRWFVEIIQPDPAMRAYFQRCMGYLLAGGNEAQIALLFTGEGGNGKSTVFSALRRVLGEYAASVKVEMFLEAKTTGSEGATPSEARLPGVRVYLASEPEPGAVLSSSKIKAFTGGDTREARMLRDAPFEWDPIGVPVLSFNRVPRIKDESGGFWRRIMPVIFPVVLSALPEKDQRTPAWIKAMIEEEAAGILNWMLEGWIDWRHREGFDPPPEVLQKKALMRASADPVGTFLSECIDLTAGMSIAAAELHDVFTAWCANDGTEAMNIRPFKKLMIDKGFHADKTGGKMKWRGITWKSDPAVDALLAGRAAAPEGSI